MCTCVSKLSQNKRKKATSPGSVSFSLGWAFLRQIGDTFDNFLDDLPVVEAGNKCVNSLLGVAIKGLKFVLDELRCLSGFARTYKKCNTHKNKLFPPTVSYKSTPHHFSFVIQNEIKKANGV